MSFSGSHAAPPPEPSLLGAKPEVVLVVPCYNEEHRLDLDAFDALLTAAEDVVVLFVDDGSRDRTLERVRAFAAARPGRVGVLALARNQGKAEAVRHGLLHALEYGPAYVGFWDADLATPLSALPTFTQVLRERPECHWVFGSRVRLLGRVIERRAARHYAGRVFATAASLTLRLPVYDTQCGAKLFRAEDALRATLRAPFLSRWIFDVEMIARYQQVVGPAVPLARRIYELPLAEWRDVQGSKVTTGAFLTAAIELARIARVYAPTRARLAAEPAAAGTAAVRITDA